MAHKVHPKVYRIREIGDWHSRGYYRDIPKLLEEDFRIREFVKTKMGNLGIEKTEIERYPGKINIIISSARPGLIIGRRGEGIEILKRSLEQNVFKKKRTGIFYNSGRNLSETSKGDGKTAQDSKEKMEIRIEIREVRNPWTSASLTAQWVAQQIVKRVAYRRVLKQVIQKVSDNKAVKGIKVELSGRLNGNEIARREWLKAGRLPLQTLRADIDFAKAEAFCTYGVIGVKIWIYKGEKID